MTPEIISTELPRNLKNAVYVRSLNAHTTDGITAKQVQCMAEFQQAQLDAIKRFVDEANNRVETEQVNGASMEEGLGLAITQLFQEITATKPAKGKE